MATAAKKTAASSQSSDEPDTTATEPEVDETDETPTEIAQPAAPPASVPVTVEDSTGTERIVGYADAWEPAQVDPTEEQLQAAEDREKAAEEAKAARLTPLEDRGKDDEDTGS